MNKKVFGTINKYEVYFRIASGVIMCADFVGGGKLFPHIIQDGCLVPTGILESDLKAREIHWTMEVIKWSGKPEVIFETVTKQGEDDIILYHTEKEF